MTGGRQRHDGLFPPPEWLNQEDRGSWEGIDLMQRVLWAQADGAMSEERLSGAAEWVTVHLSLLQAQLVQEQNYEAVRVLSAAVDLVATVGELFSPAGDKGFRATISRTGGAGRPNRPLTQARKRRERREAVAKVAALMREGMQKSAAVDLVHEQTGVPKAALMMDAPQSPRCRGRKAADA